MISLALFGTNPKAISMASRSRKSTPKTFKNRFPERLHAYNGALQYRSMIVFERGTRAAAPSRGERAGSAETLIRRRTGKGQTLYLNLSLLAYHYFPYRSGKAGESWRATIGRVLAGTPDSSLGSKYRTAAAWSPGSSDALAQGKPLLPGGIEKYLRSR